MMRRDEAPLSESLRGIAESLGVLDSRVEARLRSLRVPSVCSLHSFGVEIGGRAYAIIGVSGAGKTTLGLACCIAGAGFIGDEYGYLDWGSGRYWHADHPVCVKPGTAAALGRRLPRGAPLITPWGVRASAIPTARLVGELGFRDARRVVPPLEAIVIPQRCGSFGQEPTISRIGVSEWISRVMPSLDGACTRNELFSHLLECVSRKEVGVYRLSYSDAIAAANLMVSSLPKGRG